MKTHQKNLCKKFLVAVIVLTFMEAFEARAQDPDAKIMDNNENTVYGRGAQNGISARSNTAFGWKTQQAMYSGRRNNSFGAYASLGLANGSDNANFGYNTGASVLNGSRNSNFGNYAGFSIRGVNMDGSTGSGNSNFGYIAGYSAVPNANNGNTALGAYAMSNSTGQGSPGYPHHHVAIGYAAGKDQDFPDDKSMFILNNQASNLKPLLYGYFADNDDHDEKSTAPNGDAQLGINTTALAPYAALTVGGNTSIVGALTVGGGTVIKGQLTVPTGYQIYTRAFDDPNWRIGQGKGSGFDRDHATGDVHFLTHYGGQNEGFAVGVNGGESSFEIKGADHSVFFRGNIGIGKSPSSTAALDVSGNTSITGSLETASIKSSALTVSGNTSITGYLRTDGRLSARTISVDPDNPEGHIDISHNTILAAKSETLILKSWNTTLSSAMVSIGDGNNALQIHPGKFWPGDDSNEFISGELMAAIDMPAVEGKISFSDNVAFTHGMVSIGALPGGNFPTGEYKFTVDGMSRLKWLYNSGDKKHGTIDARIDGTVVFGGEDEEGSNDIKDEDIAGSYYSDYAVWVKKGMVSDDIAIASSDKWVNGQPDYVFNEDYKLPSLDSVQTFIQKHHHLPGIPSKAEVKERGWSLPQMDQALLKKVEELTLYIMEQDKQVRELKKMVEQLMK